MSSNESDVEGGPARRTRSSTGVKPKEHGGQTVQNSQPLKGAAINEADKFEFSFKTPAKSTSKSVKSKARTPSGQIISSSVKDIRNFFAQSNIALESQAVNKQVYSQVQGEARQLNSQPSSTSESGITEHDVQLPSANIVQTSDCNLQRDCTQDNNIALVCAGVKNLNTQTKAVISAFQGKRCKKCKGDCNCSTHYSSINRGKGDR